MEPAAPMNLGQLAHAAGLSRRAVRFYIQQKLLPAPHGLGRGHHYDDSHLDRIRHIRQLQLAGHSLDQIRQMLDGGTVPSPDTVAPPAQRRRGPGRRRTPVTVLRADLWRRLRLAEGLELSFDAARFNPSIEELMSLREMIVNVFRSESDEIASNDESPDTN
jgi:DNA-binding transcriptional MerR regulator